MSTYQMLTKTLQKIKRSEERLKLLIENKATLEAKVREKKVALDKENYDVEKLEGLSIEGFIHLLKGTLIDKLDKEEKEAMIAQNQYEIACQELDDCIRDISMYRDRVKDKFIVEREYIAYIEKQASKMVDLDSQDAQQVKDIIDRIYYHREIIREIEEADEAGVQLTRAFECILNSFEDAEDLGIVDILENGLLVSECGHETVKNANEQLVLLQQNIRKYHIEVMDVLGVTELNLDISRLLTFSDCFLVRVMTEESLKTKLSSAVALITEMIGLTKESLELMNEKKRELKLESDQLKKDKIQRIETYLNQIGGLDEESS